MLQNILYISPHVFADFLTSVFAVCSPDEGLNWIESCCLNPMDPWLLSRHLVYVGKVCGEHKRKHHKSLFIQGKSKKPKKNNSDKSVILYICMTVREMDASLAVPPLACWWLQSSKYPRHVTGRDFTVHSSCCCFWVILN